MLCMTPSSYYHFKPRLPSTLPTKKTTVLKKISTIASEHLNPLKLHAYPPLLLPYTHPPLLLQAPPSKPAHKAQKKSKQLAKTPPTLSRSHSFLQFFPPKIHKKTALHRTSNHSPQIEICSIHTVMKAERATLSTIASKENSASTPNNPEKKSVKSSPPFSIEQFLSTIKYPACSWDNEGFFIPPILHKKMKRLSTLIASNQILPFQYSIHHAKHHLQNNPPHRSFLFEPINFEEPANIVEEAIFHNLKNFLDQLLNHLKDSATIIVYDAEFEKNVLKILGKIFPSRKQQLDKYLSTMVDIRIPFRKGVIKLQGGDGLKKTAHLLIPNQIDHTVKLKNGREAMHTFFNLSKKSSRIQNDNIISLNSYCRQDSYLTLRLADCLIDTFKNRNMREVH